MKFGDMPQGSVSDFIKQANQNELQDFIIQACGGVAKDMLDTFKLPDDLHPVLTAIQAELAVLNGVMSIVIEKLELGKLETTRAAAAFVATQLVNIVRKENKDEQ